MNRDLLTNISMNAKMAYAIICLEKYLLDTYPERDFSVLSAKLWPAAEGEDWYEMHDVFVEIVPEYLFEVDNFEDSGFEFLTEDVYDELIKLLQDISRGEENDADKNINSLLALIRDLTDVYSYDDFMEINDASIEIIEKIGDVLAKSGVEVPSLGLVDFSTYNEDNGWGEYFLGEKMSLILNK